MAGLLEGKVAFITGAARGQGRSHAVRFADEGADIIAVDLCAPIDSVFYPLAQPEDLDETATLVEKTGRRVVAERADVRDFTRLRAAVDRGVAEFGRLDFVLANAGIAPLFGEGSRDIAAYRDAIDVMLNGVYYTVEATLPAMLDTGDGGAIVITSSGSGLKSIGTVFRTMNHGAAGYTAAKHGVVGLMRYYATTLAEKNIRVNSVHPGGVATPMTQNDAAGAFLAQSPEFAAAQQALLPMGLLDPEDVTAAMVYLCAESGRYVTGVALPVDAGLVVK